jgi:hypothetical protein
VPPLFFRPTPGRRRGSSDLVWGKGPEFRCGDPREEDKGRRVVRPAQGGGGAGRFGGAKAPNLSAATLGRRIRAAAFPIRPREEEGPSGTPVEARLPKKKRGDIREEERCRRFCKGPEGGGSGPAILDVTSRRPLQERSDGSLCGQSPNPTIRGRKGWRVRASWC